MVASTWCARTWLDMIQPNFWAGKRVLLTGHTGFKGAWTALWLHRMGANVSGLGLMPETEPSLYRLAGIQEIVGDPACDLRDRAAVRAAVSRSKPEIVLHLAAQALVRRSYRDPVETYATNVMGTVHLLDALREIDSVRTILVVTSDKVYANAETGEAFAESSRLGGHDPYAASKAAVELAVASYAASFFNQRQVALATVRGGNVIGGGDFSEDRIIPDLWRSARSGCTPVLRNPKATRPWQHVLDCLAGYFAYAEFLSRDATAPRCLNIGPDPGIELSVQTITLTFLEALGAQTGWALEPGSQPHEMKSLAIDPRLAHRLLGWKDRWPGLDAVRRTADWYRAFNEVADARDLMLSQIDRHASDRSAYV